MHFLETLGILGAFRAKQKEEGASFRNSRHLFARPFPFSKTSPPLNRAPGRTPSRVGKDFAFKKERRVKDSTDSGYASISSKPTSELDADHPVILPRFSWQDSTCSLNLLQSTSSQTARQPLLHAQPRRSASSVIKQLPEDQVAPTIIRSQTSPMSVSRSKNRTSRDSSALSNSETGHGLQMRDSGTPPSLPTSLMESPAKSVISDGSSARREQQRPIYKQHANGQSQDDATRASADSSAKNLSGLVSNCYCTTGRRPPGLSGGSMTVIGDKMYVFGGHALDSARLSDHLYQLVLVRLHWTRLSTTGDKPAPRYFHSMCALGETKLVLFGGSTFPPPGVSSTKSGTVPLADVYLYDIPTSNWMSLTARNPPTPRYAHCATILPSSAVFTSPLAPTTALHHNPPSAIPNHGKLGVEIDGRGAAEMIVVGGQLANEAYADSVDVFNFRSLTWTSTHPLSLSKFGIYRSAVATISGMSGYEVGAATKVYGGTSDQEEAEEESGWQSGAPAIFYSNNTFVNPQPSIQVRNTDGSIADADHRSKESPPGLRFPAAGVIANHFILGGSYMRSGSHEYMMWALNLRTLEWHRIGISSGIFERGSWNRGIAWSKRNCYIVVGDRERDFDDDYAKRRVNFSNFAAVELEAFGLYERPNAGNSAWDIKLAAGVSLITNDALGVAAMGLREVSDMDILALDGNRLPVNSHLISKRWGSYFQYLLSEDLVGDDFDVTSPSSLLPNITNDPARNRTSTQTITPASRTSVATSNASTAVYNGGVNNSALSLGSSVTAVNSVSASASGRQAPIRSRLLFLPHTYYTVRALVHYLYTSSLPGPSSTLCTPQVLCSLLQIARPYQIDGLLEATVERLHQILDGRNTAAIFNAAAMAAGTGNAVGLGAAVRVHRNNSVVRVVPALSGRERTPSEVRRTIIEDDSETEGSLSVSSSTHSPTDLDKDDPIWSGELSAVVGLQKRALRGLMEGKRMREKSRSDDSVSPLMNGGSSLTSPVTSPAE